jgi:hypothetical protein
VSVGASARPASSLYDEMSSRQRVHFLPVDVNNLQLAHSIARAKQQYWIQLEYERRRGIIKKHSIDPLRKSRVKTSFSSVFSIPGIDLDRSSSMGKIVDLPSSKVVMVG